MDKAQLKRALHIAAAILVVVLAIGLYKAKTDAARTETHVRQLQTQIGETEAELRGLRAAIAAQESPGRIEAMSEQHLGLAVGAESAALPESAIGETLPSQRRAQRR